jgi:hypothetical protein
MKSSIVLSIQKPADFIFLRRELNTDSEIIAQISKEIQT